MAVKKKAIKIFCFIAILSILFPLNTLAKSHEKKLPPRTQQDLQLIKNLSQRPELLNAKYLECYLGPKADSVLAPSPDSFHTLAPVTKISWRSPKNNYVRYKLETCSQRQNANNYLARFSLSIPDQEGVRIEDTDKVLNLKPVPGYDLESLPIKIYQTGPHTRVNTYKAPGLFDINRITVVYTGPDPGPPTEADMQEAMAQRRADAFESEKTGDYDRAIILLQAHLKANPNDPEAHLKLAEAYKARSCLNLSIKEYQTALAQSGNNDDLRKQCLTGLQALKVIPEGDVNNVPPSAPALENKALEVGF